MFSVLTIARSHEDVYGRNLVEMKARSLPDLSKQLRDQQKRQKTKTIDIEHRKQIEKTPRVLADERIQYLYMAIS